LGRGKQKQGRDVEEPGSLVRLKKKTPKPVKEKGERRRGAARGSAPAAHFKNILRVKERHGGGKTNR